jgi:acetolactate synthase I/II/III large subunit
MKGSDLFVKQLEEEKVEYIFGLPGEENLDLLESLRKSKIKLIVTRHEQAAAFMAATYGRLKRKPGICLSTLGPGATNLVTGIAHAQLIGLPMISISGQKAIKNNWQGKFQIVDIVSLMKPITKNSFTILDPANIPTMIRNSFKISETHRHGVVHLELPEDIAEEETKALIQKSMPIMQPESYDVEIKRAVEMIKNAKYPLIIVSSAANSENVSKELTNLVNKTGIYVVHTQMGKGILSDELEQSLFAVGIHKQDYVNCGINKADLIITIGYNIIEYPPSVWNKGCRKKIININYNTSENEQHFNPEIDIIGYIPHSLRKIQTLFEEKKEYPYFKKIRKLVLEKIDLIEEKSYPLKPIQIVKEVRKAMGREDIISLDNGIYKLWFSRFYKAYKYNTFLLDNALATMGAGLPVAMAAKLLNKDKKVLAVVGDGGFMMNSQEIETALRYNISVVVLILNDNAYGFIKWKQKDRNFEDFALDYNNPDFVKYAESYGAIGIKISENDNLSEVLEKAFKNNKVTIIECPIDYSPNYETFSEELKNIVCPLE